MRPRPGVLVAIASVVLTSTEAHAIPPAPEVRLLVFEVELGDEASSEVELALGNLVASAANSAATLATKSGGVPASISCWRSASFTSPPSE